MSDQITPGELLRLAANESIISAVLKWAAANGRRLSKADLERMGQGVDAMVEENARLTKEREIEIERATHYRDKWQAALARIKRLEKAGDAMAKAIGPRSRHFIYWNEAKEAKP